MRIFIFLFTIYCSLMSDENFKESRYIAAIDAEQHKYGKMYLKDDILTLSYSKPTHEKLIYNENKLTVLVDDKINEYNFTDYPQIYYMGLLLKAIIKNDYTSLSELFEIDYKDNNITLGAKPIINDVMKYIKVEKDTAGIQKITIQMINEDTITIETIN